MKNTVYQIPAGILEKGDIILVDGDKVLSEEKKKLTSKGIKIATWSKFSHAMIYLGGTCADATGKGVHFFNISRYILTSKNAIKVLRVPALNEEQKDQISNFVALCHGVPYNESMAMKSALNLNSDNNYNSQFCSKLVANAYEQIGIFFHNKKSPQNIYPGNLENSDQLKEVKMNFIEITQKEGLELVKSDPLIKQNKCVIFLYEALQNLYKTYDLEFLNYQTSLHMDIEKYSKEYKGFDSSIADIITTSGFDSLWKEEIKYNNHLYEYEKKEKFYLNMSLENMLRQIYQELKSHLSIMFEKNQMLIHLYKTNQNFKTNKKLSDLYTNVMNSSKNAFDLTIIFLNKNVLTGNKLQILDDDFDSQNFFRNEKILKNIYENFIIFEKLLFER